MSNLLRRIFRPWSVIAELEKEVGTIIDWRANFCKKCVDLDAAIARADKEEVNRKQAEMAVEYLRAELAEATRVLKAERDAAYAACDKLQAKFDEANKPKPRPALFTKAPKPWSEAGADSDGPEVERANGTRNTKLWV